MFVNESQKHPQCPLRLHVSPLSAQNGQLAMGGRRFACQIGRTGRTALKREGDGATPIGRWPLLSVLYRADRVMRPKTRLPVHIIRTDDGWCDEPLDRNYNRPVKLPYPASAEKMWRDDRAYDLVVVLDYNFSRRSMNKGSAIFLHLSHNDQRPTAGCLAFGEDDLRQILRLAPLGSIIDIQ